MFFLAVDICKQLSQTENGNKPAYALAQVIRLLHVYIFPNIEFGKAELAKLNEVLNTLNKEASDIEKLVTAKATEKENIRETMSIQRKAFIKDDFFSGMRKLAKLERQFIGICLKHILEDIEHERDNIERYEILIAPLRRSRVSEDEEKLKLLRHERNCSHANLEKLLCIREEITNFQSSKQYRSTRIRQSKQSCTYLELSERFEALETSVKDLVNRKLSVSRAREATSLAIKEIEESGRSFGYYLCKDMVDELSKNPKEWATLWEKVHDILELPRIPLGTKFIMFCAETKENCKVQKSKLLTDDSFASNENACKEMCEKVMDHIKDMSLDIARELEGCRCKLSSGVYSTDSVFACYEKYVSRELICELGEAFEACYRQQCEALIQRQSLSSSFRVRQDEKPHKYDGHEALETQVESSAIIKELTRADTIADKLRHMKNFMKCTETLLKQKGISEACTDDFVGIVIELCTKLDSDTVGMLFSQAKLLENMCPDFWAGTPHNYALVTVLAAHAYLVEQMGETESSC